MHWWVHFVSPYQVTPRPIIPISHGGKIPLVVRQRYLNLGIDEYILFLPIRLLRDQLFPLATGARYLQLWGSDIWICSLMSIHFVSTYQVTPRPIIPISHGGKIPLVVRQRYLNLFIDEYTFCFYLSGYSETNCSHKGKIPLVVRQRYLNLCIDEYILFLLIRLLRDQLFPLATGARYLWLWGSVIWICSLMSTFCFYLSGYSETNYSH